MQQSSAKVYGTFFSRDAIPFPASVIHAIRRWYRAVDLTVHGDPNKARFRIRLRVTINN